MIGMVWGQLQSRSTIVFPEAGLSFKRDAAWRWKHESSLRD